MLSYKPTPLLPVLTLQFTCLSAAAKVAASPYSSAPGLLTSLKNLPTYTKEEVWSKFVTGESRLPAVFVQKDQVKSLSCYLTIDLYQSPSVPITALERFSLADEQTDLNRLYFQCLKNGGYGIERIGAKGNVAALLGPQYAADEVWDEQFPGMFANGSISGSVNVVDLTPLDDVQTS